MSFDNNLCMVSTLNCYMGTIDLEDAYFTVLILNLDRRFTRLALRVHV